MNLSCSSLTLHNCNNSAKHTSGPQEHAEQVIKSQKLSRWAGFVPGRLEVTRELFPSSAVIKTPTEAASLDRVLIMPQAEFRGVD